MWEKKKGLSGTWSQGSKGPANLIFSYDLHWTHILDMINMIMFVWGKKGQAQGQAQGPRDGGTLKSGRCHQPIKCTLSREVIHNPIR